MTGFALAAVRVMWLSTCCVAWGSWRAGESPIYMLSPSDGGDLSTSIGAGNPLLLLHQAPSLVSMLCFGSPPGDMGEPVGLTALLVSQELRQQWVLLQFALPQEHLGLFGKHVI